MIRVLIAEDSPVAMEYLKHILVSSGSFEVVATARDGERAVKLAEATNPDVILMDINMPRMDGFEATRRIMEAQPTPIVIVSASWDPRDVNKTFQAMEVGAVAALEKPPGPGHPNAERLIREILQTVRLMSEVPVVRRWARRREKEAPRERRLLKEVGAISDGIELVAMGTSTGGPPVIRTILSDLPKGFSAPILIVQHIAEGFLAGFAEWVDRSCDLSVGLGRHGQALEPGHVYLAPDKLHMGVTREGRIALNDGPPENNLCPSVSYLFRSVAREFEEKAAGVLLTGMGEDGAQELKLIRDCGGVTIVQDRESSAVHGMPGEAERLGAATHVLPPDMIAQVLKSITKKR